LILVRSQGSFKGCQVVEKLKAFDDSPNHRGKVGILILAEEIAKITDVVVAAILNALAKSLEIEPWASAAP
jgi:hypothetical protein